MTDFSSFHAHRNDKKSVFEIPNLRVMQNHTLYSNPRISQGLSVFAFDASVKFMADRKFESLFEAAPGIICFSLAIKLN